MITCPSCGQENPARARFCFNCGAPLDHVQPGATEERKLITVLFADLAGFTARSDRADPEDVKAFLRVYHARAKQVVEHYGGTLEKFIGDGVLAVFGAPAAHEDDPERAVRAGISLQEALDELNRSTAVDLAARVGVDAGEALVSFGTGPATGERITGDVVARAGQLQAAAPVGGVAVSNGVYLATRHRFEFEPLEPALLEGEDDRTPIWRAVHLRATLGVGVEHRERPDTPFVGRAEQTGELKAAFRRAVGEPSIQLVTVVGDAGLGKSRLIGELFHHVDDLPDIFGWRQGRCLPYGDAVTFWPLGEVVKATAGILDSDAPTVTIDKLDAAVERVVADPARREWFVERLAPVVGRAVGMEDGARPSERQGDPADRASSFQAWREYLELVAADRPTVVVFEDVHWAEDAMLDFVEELTDSTARVPLLVVCAARPELVDRRPSWGRDRRASTLIELEPLAEPDTALLISALLDRAVLPAETQSLLLDRAGGNPLYAEEFVRMLRDHDLLEERGRVLTLRAGADVPVPVSVQTLIAARIDALPGEQKALLHDAAVLGKVFWAGALAAMENLDAEGLVDLLDALTRKEMIRPSRRSSLEGEHEYTFWHLLVRDVAYGQIPRSDRATKHRAAATWIERVARDRAVDQSELLAYHYDQALEWAQATRRDDLAREIEPHLVRFLVAAGDKSMRLDVGRAEASYRRALELLPERTDGRPNVTRARVLARAADAATLAGRLGDSGRDYRSAIEAFRAAGDAQGAGGAMALLSRTLHRTGDTTGARALIQEAVELLEAVPPSRELVRAYTRYAGQSLIASRNEECVEVAGKGLALAERFGMDDEVVRALQYRGAARLELGDEGGLDDLTRALDLARETGVGEERAIATGNLAFQLWLREGPAAGLETWREARTFAEGRGYQAHAMWTRAGMLECLFDLGRWDELMDLAEEMLAWDRDHGRSQVGMLADIYRVRVLTQRGTLEAAAEPLPSLLGEVRPMEHAEFVAPALIVAAQAAAARGDSTEALSLLREFGERTADAPSFRCLYLPDALREAVELGEIPFAEALVPDRSAATTNRHRLALLAARAILAEARGEPGAAGLYEYAASAWRDYGSVIEQTLHLAGAARCRASLGEDDAAEELLAQARTLAATVPGWQPVRSSDDPLAEASAN